MLIDSYFYVEINQNVLVVWKFGHPRALCTHTLRKHGSRMVKAVTLITWPKQAIGAHLGDHEWTIWPSWEDVSWWRNWGWRDEAFCGTVSIVRYAIRRVATCTQRRRLRTHCYGKNNFSELLISCVRRILDACVRSIVPDSNGNNALNSI